MRPMSKLNGTHALSLGDRMALLSALPQEGSLATIKIVHELRMALSPSEEENREFEITWDKERTHMKWNPAKSADKEIEIGPVATGIIASALKALDKHQKLTEAHLGVYERFVGQAT